MRDEKEERKKEASKVKQTTRQSNTAHPRQSHVRTYTLTVHVHVMCNAMCMLYATACRDALSLSLQAGAVAGGVRAHCSRELLPIKSVRT